MTLPHDMIGIYAAVANANHMPAWGGAENLLSTNPIAVAVPAGQEPPVVLDIATTVVSYGTVKAYKLQGKPMPEGWMVSAKDGKPITDPAQSAEGLLMPIGGHKGSGLALVLGLLAGTLNGAAFGREVVDFNADDESACNTGHFIIALDVARFLPIAAFKAEVDRQLRDLKSSKVLPGFDSIRLPGEQRQDPPRRARRQRRAGVSGGGRAARQARGRIEDQAAGQLAAAGSCTPLSFRGGAKRRPGIQNHIVHSRGSRFWVRAFAAARNDAEISSRYRATSAPSPRARARRSRPASCRSPRAAPRPARRSADRSRS